MSNMGGQSYSEYGGVHIVKHSTEFDSTNRVRASVSATREVIHAPSSVECSFSTTLVRGGGGVPGAAHDGAGGSLPAGHPPARPHMGLITEEQRVFSQRPWYQYIVSSPWARLVTSSKLEFGHLAKSQMTFGDIHQTPTFYG
jgi:hypothetical protein